MLKEEFLKLTGINEISDDKYRPIEILYEELCSDIDKKEFCEMYRGRDFDSLLKWCIQMAVTKRYQSINADRWKNHAETLAKDVVLCSTNDANLEAYDILGTAEAIKLKIDRGMAGTLTDDDLAYIKENLE